MCTESFKSFGSAAKGYFNPRIIHPHKPEIMCITCIDGREAAGQYFEFDDSAIRVTEIAAVIPPYSRASASLRAKFSFTKFKGISQIKVVGHSFCGGAETAIAYPEIDVIENEDVRNIVSSLAESGADLPRLRNAFMRAVEGDKRHAANLLSRHLTIVSANNISTYPDMNDLFRERKLDLIPLYHMMKQGSGELSHLERYDVEKRVWLRVDQEEQPATHMCERPFNCAACINCQGTIEMSLGWTAKEYLTNDGHLALTELPDHIARLIQARRDFYQPKLSAVLNTGKTMHVKAPFSPANHTAR